jgi:hypothetical protein
MANIFIKLPLSASSYGMQIPINGTTSGSATPIHTAVTGSSAIDEIWMYAYNDATASIMLSINWGSLVEPANVVRSTLPSQSGRILIIDGKLLYNGLLISAYAGTGSYISIDGYVNRIISQ